MTHLLRSFSKLIPALCALFAFVASSAQAQTLNATSTGWYAANGVWSDAGNLNYYAGYWYNSYFDNHSTFVHNFASFEVPTLSGPLLSASLRYYNPSAATGNADGYSGGTTFSTFEVFGVNSVSSASLPTGAGSYGDLISGGFLASTQVNSTFNGAWVTVDLTSMLSLQYITDHSGQAISFGGSLASETAALFAGTHASPQHPYVAPQLILVQESVESSPPITAVPEPSTYGLIGASGLLGLLALRRRRAARNLAA